MNEHILAAVVRLNEAEALVVVEPLDATGHGDRGGRVRRATRRARRIAERTLWRTLDRTGRVDFEDPRDLRTLHPVADADLQLRAGRNRLIACGLQGTDVEKRVSGTVRQFDEAEALVALEPLDDGVNRCCRCRPAAHIRGAGRTSTEAAAERRSRRAVQARCVVRGWSVVVETTLLGTPEISTFAHVVPARLRHSPPTPSLSPKRIQNHYHDRPRMMGRQRTLPASPDRGGTR